MSTKGRRGHGEGSIYRAAGGKWRAVVDLGWQDGKRVRKYVTGATRQEAAGKLRALLHAVDQGNRPAKEVTVEQHLRRWVDETLPGRVAPKAIESYESVVRVHLIPAFGKTRLSALTPADVERLLNVKISAGLALSTVRRIRSVLAQALRQAERWGLVSRNVAALVDPPKLNGRSPAQEGQDQAEQRHLTIEEARRLLAAAEGTRMAAPVTLMLATGLRRGEVLGLRWADVDLAAGVLMVKRALGAVYGRAEVVDVKTAKSRRTIDLAPPVVEALRAHRAGQVAEQLASPRWDDAGYVFPSTTGGAWHPRNFSRSFARIVRGAGLDGTGVHPNTTRHTATSTMLASGVPVEVVMAVLGHSTPRMTLGVYAHTEQPARRAAADALAAAMFRPEQPNEQPSSQTASDGGGRLGTQAAL